jgi:hypothetical protein
MISARLCEGFTVDDFKAVINLKYSTWQNDAKMSGYLRPITLFCPKHFESYVQESKKKTAPVYSPAAARARAMLDPLTRERMAALHPALYPETAVA